MNEKIIEIRKATQKQTVVAIKSGDFSEVKKIEDAARQEAENVFLAVASATLPGSSPGCRCSCFHTLHFPLPLIPYIPYFPPDPPR